MRRDHLLTLTLNRNAVGRLFLMLMLLFAQFTAMQAADWMKRADKFYMSNHDNHVTLNVFLCDLDNGNTYAKSGGIYAKNSSGQTMWLLDLCYIEEGSDENAFGKVNARYCIGESRAWFSNGYGTQEQQIGFGGKDFLLQKWGSDNHYLTAAVEFYYPASMAGQTWTFYYQYTHNNGGEYTMTLGSASLSNTLGLSHFNTKDYQCERTGPDKIRFTVPALPNDVDSKLSDIHIHEGTYKATFTYTCQNNSKVTQTETLACVKGNKKSYDLSIPENVGNPKQIDLRVEATDGLKDSRNYYWKTTNTYNTSNVFKVVPVPNSLTTDYRQFDKAADLSWNAFPSDATNILDCTPYVYRMETDKNGDPLSGSWSKRGSVDNAGGNQLQGYRDNNVQSGTYYKYMVLNVPTSWIDNGIASASLNSPTSQLIGQLGSVESGVLQTKATLSIYNLRQDTTVTDKVRLTWQYTRVPATASTVTFTVLRRTSDDAEWSDYGNVAGDTEPRAGTELSFVDTDLPSVSTRYQYMIRLTLNNDNFDSDPIYAGLLGGSMVKSFEATKGTHDATVRLSWNAKQVGTDPTTYVVSRRYVGSNGDFIKINTTSGTAALYTYEDNTVQSGYYYEYRIEAFNGSLPQNALTDVGFCQARGVISGRVTFGTGSAVEDVRLTLRATGASDDNVVKGYSQHLDGASTGIAWKADSVETAKVFGADKDYTIQFFVRPDADLHPYAVIGEIPGMGRLLVGDKKGDGYKLLVERYADVAKAENQFTNYWDIQCIFEDLTAKDNGEAAYYNEEFSTWMYTTDTEYFAKGDAFEDNGYQRLYAGWYQNTSRNIWFQVYGKALPIAEQVVSLTNYSWQGQLYDTSLTIPAATYSLLTLQHSNQAYTLSVDDRQAALPQTATSTRQHSLSESNVEKLSADYHLRGDNCLYKVSGTTDELMVRGYSEAYNTAYDLSKWFPNIAMTVSRPAVFPRTFAVGGGEGLEEDEAFGGDLTEVRVWSHALSEKERKAYYDRMLNGRETGLAIYWPMDEGLNRYVFDASYANDMPNGRHATVGNNISVSTIIPADNQLSRYAVTDANGEYIIRGIPFVGSGSSYAILPTRGIHDFSPISRNGFIGNGSLILNGYDFTDVSSFPVRGKVTYLNTNIPVDSVQFMIDGSLLQSKEGVRSDANGEFEISVPIGNHRIECYMNGHKFTSFPLDGSTYDFKRAETVNFVDSTLVNVTGRINGGFSDRDEPLGFRRSVNRLGKATIKLSLGREAQCSFNYIVDSHGDGKFGTTDIPVASATDSIQSTAYRAGGEHDETYFIYITTDEKTGEFSAMLPPLKYKVESIKFEGGTDYDDLPIFAQNLPIIDASNTIEEKMRNDSLSVEGVGTLKYKYCAKMIRQYRSNPTISVAQTDLRTGIFGEQTIEISNADFTTEAVEIVRITDNDYTYHFGHPIFLQDKAYTLGIDVSENYKNLDTGETFKEIPKDAVVNIANDASSTTTVYGEDGTVNGEEVKMGQAYETHTVEVTPDKDGHVEYQFVAGAPNFAEGYIHNMSIGTTIDGRTTMWQAPDSQTEALDLIVLGSIGSGTNFVTRGPYAVDMVLRRPPGSTSVASLTNKTIRSYSHTVLDTDGGGDGGGGYISETPTWEIESGTVMGIALLTKSKFKIVVNQKLSSMDKWSDTDIATNDTTYTVTDAMSTPSAMVIDLETKTYKPEGGDTYIGRSTNLLFSKGRILGIYKQDDGSYKIDQKEGITVGQEFGTEFVFPQAYIENTLIPNWEAIIKSKLVEGHISGDHWDINNTPKVPGKVMYYTKYNPGDPEFGKANGDKKFWTQSQIKTANGCPSYKAVNGTDDPNVQDEVQDAINQIALWRARIADNEKDKLDAFEDAATLIDNYSIASGTKVGQTTETSIKRSTSHKHETSYTFNGDFNFGEMLNDAGAYATISVTDFDNHSTTHADGNTISNSVAWTMSDGDQRTALTVDVYRSPSGWGPIFRTRGGQTVNPYEGASYTKYYQEGTLLNEATMKIENPQLTVKGSTELTNIPTGGEARFVLQLYNNSETNSLCNYILETKDASNPNGAVLMMDGAILSNGRDGRSFKLKGNETVEKLLVVKQGDRSITDYDNIKLVLKSEKDASVESEPVLLHVQFVPASAHVDLEVDHTILNKAFRDDNDGITATMKNLDRLDDGLQGIRLRYRRKGTDTWNVIKQWTTLASLLGEGYEAMPDSSSFAAKVTFLDDGLYELQAQTFGKYGNDDVTYESNIVEVTQDTHGPKILGMPSPENGQITYLNRNNMHIRFNESLNGNTLSKSDNFRIEGGMNNVVSGGAYPDVAVQLNGERIETEALYDLVSGDYAFDLWLYRQGDGTIISLGTDNNLLSLSTHDDGQLQARIGTEEDVFDTGAVLPAEKWTYIALNYKRRGSGDSQNRITMLFASADDTEPHYVGKNMPANDLTGHGQLAIGGDGLQGMIAEMTIWNSDITATELYEKRKMSKATHTPGLVGYWRMDEGHGKKITDRARSRHLYMPSESWYINNENRAAHIDALHTMPVDIATFNPSKTDNYAIELWFRGSLANNYNRATLFSVLNGIRVGFDNWKMKLQVIGQEVDPDTGTPVATIQQDVELTDKNYLDGAWHHFALNVRRGTSAIAYVDGEAVKVIPENIVPGLSGKHLYIGAQEIIATGEAGEAFTGDIDEVRLWSAALDGQLIANRMYDRLDSSYAGLVGYFPMEEIHRTEQGDVKTDFSTANFGEADSRLKIDAELTQSVNAPALKPGSTRMRLEEFNFTASESEIYFSFPDSSLPLMDNNDFVATVKYIKDEHGNNSETVEWMFHTDFACVGWDNSISVPVHEYYKRWNETGEIYVPVYNKTGQPQTYEISGLPTWMTVDKPVGTVVGDCEYVTFVIRPTVTISKHTEYIYLTDRLGIRRAFRLNLTVLGDDPNWQVNPDLYESNMMITGQVYVDDKISEFTETKIAAFDDMGLCRGVASPHYVDTRDAYYVDMVVYGASATELSTGQRDLTFKMYDASSGKLYPLVNISLPDGTSKTTITYAPDAVLGNYDNPVKFSATEDLQQTVDLPTGWTWMSIYVQPPSTLIADVLPQSKAELKKFRNVKGKTKFASAKTDGSAIIGELTDIVPGSMYKIQVSAISTFNILGKTIDLAATTQTIEPGFNWIGSLSSAVMSPEDAFAGLMPENGDMVKNRRTMAVYRDGIWEGTLKSIVPGEGYIYESKADETKVFNYPLFSAFLLTGTQAKTAIDDDGESPAAHYQPVNDHRFPDNMNIIAVVKKDGRELPDAEVAAFIGDECRGAVTCNSGYYFLTIMGAASADVSTPVELRVFADGHEYIFENAMSFISDAVYGTLEEPYVLDVNATGILVVNGDNADNDGDWYTLQGYKMTRKPTHQGVYIHNGRKVVIK